MENRNKMLTFILAFIPGVGQMYLGLMKKGIQLLALFFLVEPVLGFIGLNFIAFILHIVIWCYAFFDTFEVAKRLDRGEDVPDTEFFFVNFMGNQGAAQFNAKGLSDSRTFWIVGGWALVVVGVMSILNMTFGDFELYHLIKSYISSYFVPVALVGAGIYLLSKNKKIG